MTFTRKFGGIFEFHYISKKVLGKVFSRSLYHHFFHVCRNSSSSDFYKVIALQEKLDPTLFDLSDYVAWLAVLKAACKIIEKRVSYQNCFVKT